MPEPRAQAPSPKPGEARCPSLIARRLHPILGLFWILFLLSVVVVDRLAVFIHLGAEIGLVGEHIAGREYRLSLQPGINLSWTYANKSAAIVDLFLFYANVTDKGPIAQLTLPAAATSTNVAPALLLSGKSYVFSLQAVDASGNKFSSNNFKPSAPFAVAAPTLASVVGFHNALTCNVTYPAIPAGDSALTGSPTITFTLLDVATTEFIYFTKPSGRASYTFSSADDARIVDYVQFEVSCFITPDAADSKHNAPSALSNTLIALVSDTPSAPTILNPLADFFNNAEVLGQRRRLVENQLDAAR